MNLPTVSDFLLMVNKNENLKFKKEDFKSHFKDADNDDLKRIKIKKLPDNGNLMPKGFKTNKVVLDIQKIFKKFK